MFSEDNDLKAQGSAQEAKAAQTGNNLINDDNEIDAALKALSEGTPSKEQEELLAKYDKESANTKMKSTFVANLFYLVCIGVTFYHLYTVIYFPPPTLINRSIHVAMMMVLCFFMYPLSKKTGQSQSTPWYEYAWMALAISVPAYVVFEFKGVIVTMVLCFFMHLLSKKIWSKNQSIQWYDCAWMALAISVPVYMFLEWEGIIMRSLIPNRADEIFATILVVVVIEGARRAGGWPLPIICMSFLAYGLYGRSLPGMFMHRGYTWRILTNHLFSNTEGIFGTSVAVAASFIFMFILFGAVMSKSGMGSFFTDLAMALAGHTKGGPAKVVVIASALLSSINGSAVANVVTTGPFTIPLMKKIGYTKEFAGAVESAASIGGQILPPVMGAAAFIMAEITGYRYSDIIVFAALPAVLFYLGVFVQVQLRASKDNLVGVPREKLPKTLDVLKDRGHLLIPIITLVYFLMFTPITVTLAALYTIGVTILVAQLRKSTRMSIKDIFDACADGARQTAPVAAACAAVGIVVGVISITGFGMAMVNAIVSIGGQNMALTLIFTMFTCLVLGLGVPSIPAYIITASIAAPALVQLGVPLISAHLFVFYFAMFANITPPAGLVALAASGISGANPITTGVQALKLSLAGFVIPFMFVYSNQLLLRDVTFFEGVQAAVMACLGVFLLGVAVEGYLFNKVNILLRIVAFGAAILLIAPYVITDIIGLVLFAVVVFYQFVKRRRLQAAIPI